MCSRKRSKLTIGQSLNIGKGLDPCVPIEVVGLGHVGIGVSPPRPAIHRVIAHVVDLSFDDRADFPRANGLVRGRIAVVGHAMHADLEFQSRSNDQQIPASGRTSVAAYGLLGLGMRWKLSQRCELNARLDNVSDENYETLIGFTGSPRSLRGGLRIRLPW